MQATAKNYPYKTLSGASPQCTRAANAVHVLHLWRIIVLRKGIGTGGPRGILWLGLLPLVVDVATV